MGIEGAEQRIEQGIDRVVRAVLLGLVEETAIHAEGATAPLEVVGAGGPVHEKPILDGLAPSLPRLGVAAGVLRGVAPGHCLGGIEIMIQFEHFAHQFQPLPEPLAVSLLHVLRYAKVAPTQVVDQRRTRTAESVDVGLHEVHSIGIESMDEALDRAPGDFVVDRVAGEVLFLDDRDDHFDDLAASGASSPASLLPAAGVESSVLDASGIGKDGGGDDGRVADGAAGPRKSATFAA